MKYKILTDGEFFIVKLKTFIFWHTYIEHSYYGCMISLPHYFGSEKSAEKKIIYLYGASAIRVRKYRIT